MLSATEATCHEVKLAPERNGACRWLHAKI